ncbi:TPA: hexulose-6-phosphate synthase, partial [Salmonella enterica]
RFFLSGNELTVSNLSNHSKNYYFYLVQYGKDGEPCNLYVKHAQDLYTNSEMSPCAYVVRFDLEEPA